MCGCFARKGFDSSYVSGVNIAKRELLRRVFCVTDVAVGEQRPRRRGWPSRLSPSVPPRPNGTPRQIQLNAEQLDTYCKLRHDERSFRVDGPPKSRVRSNDETAVLSIASAASIALSTSSAALASTALSTTISTAIFSRPR